MSEILSAPRTLWRFFKSTFAEAQRITWPTRPQAIRLTAVVVVVCVTLGGALAALDYGLSLLLAYLIG